MNTGPGYIIRLIDDCNQFWFHLCRSFVGMALAVVISLFNIFWRCRRNAIDNKRNTFSTEDWERHCSTYILHYHQSWKYYSKKHYILPHFPIWERMRVWSSQLFIFKTVQKYWFWWTKFSLHDEYVSLLVIKIGILNKHCSSVFPSLLWLLN